jgi:hypothetical protein
MDAVSGRLADIFAAHRWIVVGEVSAGTGLAIEQLRKWGGEEFLVVAGSEGVGDQPDCEVLLMPSPPGTVMEGFRRFAARLQDPPDDVRSAVRAFDPDHTARAIGPMFAVPPEFLGRRLYGARPPRWEELEDKTGVDQVWGDAGVPRAESRVVPLSKAPAVSREMAGPLGTVWAADNTEGWHGGGEYTRWVADADSARRTVEDLRGRARRVRVMPFLDGLPCSIHGVVTSDGVAALRPVELLILRRRDRTGFVYAGVADTWDPPDEVRQEMRTAARSVGEVLRRRLDYRGPFSIDGVCTADGFRPTELNPRFSVGYYIQASTVEALHGTFFVRALVEGDLEVRASELEEAIVDSADRTRVIRMGVPVSGTHAAATLGLTLEDGAVRISPDGSLLEIGPSPHGSFMFWKVDGSTVPPGPPFASHAAAAIRTATAVWGLDLPDLEPAPDLLRK